MSRQGETRKRVRTLLAEGKSYREITLEIGIVKSTIGYHARALGIPPDTACARRYDWAEVQRYYDEGHSAKACRERFGFSSRAWHEAEQRDKIMTRPRAPLIDAFLVTGRRVNRYSLKRRLISAGLKEPRCELCGIEGWRGRPLSFDLHHRNGDGLDNRLENLEILCPNCHSQTENFGVRNRQQRR